jgi:molybdenum cofactor guanylyltransferase
MLVGIFVGGRGVRMGGVAKGLLQAPGSPLTLVERLRDEVRAALPSAELVLVGAGEAYGSLGLPQLADRPLGVGPMGGLAALLAHAEQRGAGHALALACDLPHLERTLLARLGREAPEADALVVDSGGFRNPLIARYATRSALDSVARVLARGQRALQAVLDDLPGGVTALKLDEHEQRTLVDWDTPSDLDRDAH